MNKNEIYVLNQPKHTIMTCVVIFNVFPKSQDIHDNLDKLQEISDLMFIFQPDVEKYINPEKFASLYQACGYIVADSNIDMSLVKSMYYSKEIFNKHISYLITTDTNLEDLENPDKAINNIVQVNISTIQKPILEILRLSDEQLFDYYTLEPEKNFNKVKKFFGFSKGSDVFNMFTTHNTKSNIIFLREITIDGLLELYGESDKKIMNFLNSFQTNKFPGTMIASYLRQSGIPVLEKSIELLDINKLKS